MLKYITLFVALCICSLVSAKSTNYQKVLKTPYGVPYQGKAITVNKKILSTSKIEFVSHPAGVNSWLGMNFDFQYVKPIFDTLNSTQVPLLNRGESHITVITPPEFALLSTANVTIEQVDSIAKKLNIQKSKVSIVCLGREEVVENGTDMIVYQIIVKAPNLNKIREEIFKVYYQQGGNPALFDPNFFYPHITVGFTSGDLFDVYKGPNVCYRPITLK